MIEETIKKVEEKGVNRRILISILRLVERNIENWYTPQRYFDDLLRLTTRFNTGLEQITQIKELCHGELDLIYYDGKKEKTLLTRNGRNYLRFMETEK